MNEKTWISGATGQAIYNASVSNCSANLMLTGIGDGYVDFKVTVHYLNTTLYKEVDHVETTWDWVSFNGTKSNNGKALTDLTLNNASDEFFCSITFLSGGPQSAGWSGAAEIQIAFSVEPYLQFDLGGTINNPISMGYQRQRMVAAETNLTSSNGYLVSDNNFSRNDLRLVPIDSSQGRISILTHEQVSHTTTRIVATMSDGSSRITSGSTGTSLVPSSTSTYGVIHPTFYGLVHDVFFWDINSAPQQVPSWWVQGTHIRVGVHVFSPSKARILSDLQYYNMYYDWSETASRELWAYELDTHGTTIPSFIGSDYAVVTSDDVKAIWGTWGDHNSYPRATVILADYCASYYLSTSGLFFDKMAKAFVDYGASSYIGAQIITVPGVMDPFTTTFWQSICFQKQTVHQASDNAQTSEYNYLISIGDPLQVAVYFQWQVAFGIYGSRSQTIP